MVRSPALKDMMMYPRLPDDPCLGSLRLYQRCSMVEISRISACKGNHGYHFQDKKFMTVNRVLQASTSKSLSKIYTLRTPRLSQHPATRPSNFRSHSVCRTLTDTTPLLNDKGSGCAHAQQVIWQLFNAIEQGHAAAGDTDTEFLNCMFPYLSDGSFLTESPAVLSKRAQMDKGVRVGSWGQLQGQLFRPPHYT